MIALTLILRQLLDGGVVAPGPAVIARGAALALPLATLAVADVQPLTVAATAYATPATTQAVADVEPLHQATAYVLPLTVAGVADVQR